MLCLHLLYKILSNLCFVLFTSPLQNVFVLFCLHLLYKILSNLCFVLFTSPLQNIKQPLFCFVSPLQNIKQPLFRFVYISFTKYYATFVLFCLHLLYKILSNLCFVLFTSPLQNIKQPLFCFVFVYISFTKY